LGNSDLDQSPRKVYQPLRESFNNGSGILFGVIGGWRMPSLMTFFGLLAGNFTSFFRSSAWWIYFHANLLSFCETKTFK
jgi:hypothetical protein